MPTLYELASMIKEAHGNFSDFHKEAEKYDQLFKQRQQPEFTKQAPQPNLKELAKSCLSFSEFHARASEE